MKLSCSKIALNRWIRTERRWYKKLASLSLADWREILRSSFDRKSQAESLIGPSVVHSNRLEDVATVQVSILSGLPIGYWACFSGCCGNVRIGQRAHNSDVPSEWFSCLPGDERKTAGLLSVWAAKTLWFLWNRNACRCHGPGSQVIQGMMSGWSAWSLLTDKARKAQCIDWSPIVAQWVKVSNQAADRLPFVLVHRQVSGHMMIWAWQKANPTAWWWDC